MVSAEFYNHTGGYPLALTSNYELGAFCAGRSHGERGQDLREGQSIMFGTTEAASVLPQPDFRYGS